MDGFKDSTKMKYMTYNPNATIGDQVLGTAGSRIADRGMKGTGLLRAQKLDPNAVVISDSRPQMGGMKKGGSVKGEAKMAKVMGEFASGKLHSGSKKGPEVTNKKQAVAIAMSEARKAGAKMPMKKGLGGGVFNERGKRATMAELAAEDRRMARRPSEGVSSRPTDDSGRRATDAELGMTSPAKKAVGPSSVAVSKVLAGMAKPMKKNMGGGVNSKLGKAIENAKAAMTAAPRAKSTLVDMLPKNSPQKPSSGNPLMGGLNRGDTVASKHTPTRGPSMAPAFSDRPMIRRKTGGLTAMPKGKC